MTQIHRGGGGCSPHPSSCGPQQAKGASGPKANPCGKSGEKTPPGLANKPGGMPPGQYKHMFDRFDWGGNNSQGTMALPSANTQGQQQSGGGGFLSNAFNWLGGLFGFGNSPTHSTAVDHKNTTTVPAPDITGAPQTGKAKDLPFISQYDPAGKDANYLNGAENCGPAVLAMVAKSRGQTDGLTDAQLVTKMMNVAKTTGDGTSGNGMIDGLESLGMQTTASAGADLNFINTQLAQGHEVISNGDFYSVPGHTDPGQVAGHYLAVTGVNGGVYSVVDPADPNVHTMTAQQLQDFISSHPDGGFSIGAW